MSKSRAESVNKTKSYYKKLSKLIYNLGGPNYWYKDQDVPKYVKVIHDGASILIDILIYCFLAAQWTSLFTQRNLSNKQKSDLVLFSVRGFMLYPFVNILSLKKQKIRDVSYELAITLKEPFNDTEVEKHMVKQVKFYVALFAGFLSFTVVMYGINAAVEVFKKDGTFVTLITVWPDIDDRSLAAGIARVVIYSMWGLSSARILFAAYIIIIAMTVGLSHQYKNLCSYFYSLNDVFEETLTQEEKEKKYEEALKVGIDLHSITLRCTKVTQEILTVVLSNQVIFNVGALTAIMFKVMNSDRTLGNAFAAVFMMCSILVSTGCIWWNAGDVTVAASHLPTAMFNSGWQHCGKGATPRIRHMLLIAIWQSQIVKFSYSIFSVIY